MIAIAYGANSCPHFRLTPTSSTGVALVCRAGCGQRNAKQVKTSLALQFRSKRLIRHALSGLAYQLHLQRAETGVVALASRKLKERVFTAWRWAYPGCLQLLSACVKS